MYHAQGKMEARRQEPAIGTLLSTASSVASGFGGSSQAPRGGAGVAALAAAVLVAPTL